MPSPGVGRQSCTGSRRLTQTREGSGLGRGGREQLDGGRRFATERRRDGVPKMLFRKHDPAYETEGLG